MARILRTPLPTLNNLTLDVQEILDGGWKIGPARSLLLVEMHGSGRRDDWTSDTVGSEEWEVNDVDVESWGLPTDKEMFQTIMAARAFAFAIQVMLKARDMEAADTLVGVISVADHEDYLTGGTTAHFFTRRGKYRQSFDGDLETFRLEAVAVFDMHDAERWPDVLDEVVRQHNLQFGT